MQTLSGTLDTEPLPNATLLLDAARPPDTENRETAIADVATAAIYMHARDAIAVAAMIGIQNANKLRCLRLAMQRRERGGHFEVLIHVSGFENTLFEILFHYDAYRNLD
jgi:hypothetical protein